MTSTFFMNYYNTQSELFFLDIFDFRLLLWLRQPVIFSNSLEDSTHNKFRNPFFCRTRFILEFSVEFWVIFIGNVSIFSNKSGENITFLTTWWENCNPGTGQYDSLPIYQCRDLSALMENWMQLQSLTKSLEQSKEIQ